MALWQDTCDGADLWLNTATKDSLKLPLREGENGGILLIHCIFHTLYHLGKLAQSEIWGGDN